MHRFRPTIFLVALVLTFAASPFVANAATHLVPGDFASIQAAINAANHGDTIQVDEGTYVEDINFHGKQILVQGSGPNSIISGTGTDSVVTFASGEDEQSQLEGFTISGGNAISGGGILIDGASPVVMRNVIRENRAASRGSGIYIVGGGAPQIYNNLVIYNEASGSGDPHAIQLSSSSPSIVNNTVVRNDSNAVFTSGFGSPVIMNNILGYNGSRPSTGRKGRGICDFANGTTIAYNLFYRNAKSALLTAGRDFRRIERAELVLDRTDLRGNVDGNPRFVRNRPPRPLLASVASVADFDLRTSRRPGPAFGAGNPDLSFNNNDGSRNTIGHLGGPFGAQP